MNILKHISLLLIVLFVSTTISAQHYSAKASLDTNVILMGDQTVLHLSLQQPRGKIVYWPPITENIGENIEVVEISENDTIIVPGSELIDINVDITITSWDTGLISLPPLPFIYATINDSTQLTVETQEMKMYIAQLKVDMEKGITDIKPIIEAPLTFMELLPALLWSLLITFLLALVFYVYYRWKNNKPIIPLPRKPKTPAHIIAYADLDKLKEEKLWQNGNAKEYYSELTDIFRVYLENRMFFGAPEMITDEIMTELSKKAIDKDLLEQTKKILETSDFVKFAKIQPIESENNEAMEWAYNFIESTRIKDEENNSKKGKKK